MHFRGLGIPAICAQCASNLNCFLRLTPHQVCVHDVHLHQLKGWKKCNYFVNSSFSLLFVEAACPEWSELEQAMSAVHSVVHGLVKFSKVGAVLLCTSNTCQLFLNQKCEISIL